MMQVGTRVQRKGDITSLNFIGAGTPQHLEQVLGFGPGRLRAGYAVLALAAPVAIADFELGGMTHLSGGRFGLPKATPAADALRQKVDDAVKRDYDEGGRKLRELAATKINRLTGAERTVKIVPVTGHDDTMAPNKQYPQGTGAPQWKLIVPKAFTVLLSVDAKGIASGVGFTAPVGPKATLDERTRLFRYLATQPG